MKKFSSWEEVTEYVGTRTLKSVWNYSHRLKHKEKAIASLFEIRKDIHQYKEEKFIEAVRLFGKDYQKMSEYFDSIYSPNDLAMYKHHV